MLDRIGHLNLVGLAFLKLFEDCLLLDNYLCKSFLVGLGLVGLALELELDDLAVGPFEGGLDGYLLALLDLDGFLDNLECLLDNQLI